MPAPAPDVMVLRCGPKPMNDAMKGYLDAIGYGEDAQFEF
jgi:cytochrome-b5 reductase